MTVLAAVRQRKARWIAEPVGCAVDDFGDHGERAHRARAHARREQQIGKVGRAAIGSRGQVGAQPARIDVARAHLVMSGHDQVGKERLRV